MAKLKPEQILDRSVSLLQKGGTVSDCLKKYPNTRGLKADLLVVEQALKLAQARKTHDIDRGIVWQKIASQIQANSAPAADLQTQPVTESPRQEIRAFSPFRIVLPKTVYALITIVAFTGLINATSVAAENSLPGETLYIVKKTVEKVDLAFTLDDQKKTEKRIQHAENRLTEATTIVSKGAVEAGKNLGENESKTVGKTIQELVTTTEKIASESENNKALLEQVVELTDKQAVVLTALETKVASSTKELISGARNTLTTKKDQAKQNLGALNEAAGAGTATTTPQTATTSDQTIDGIFTPGVGGSSTTTSSTPDGLIETLGDPDASSTTNLVPPSETTTSTETTTPEIVEIR